MADILTETLVTLPEAAKRLPHHPGPSTMWRWYAKGVRGQRLETVVIGGRRLTSMEALSRFAKALTVERDGAATPKRRNKRGGDESLFRAKWTLDPFTV